MGESKNLLENFGKNHSISRRGFVKGVAATGAVAALYGCSKEDGGDVIYGGGGVVDSGIISDDVYYTKTPTYRYGTSAHNCGGRCIIKAQVTGDGRIVRFLTDDSQYAFDGTFIDNENRNSTQSRACSRCRGYKGRLYHPGRLKYPLKQTKERGDLTGFKRISWKAALQEITERLKAVQGEYGPETFHSIYACGNIASQFQGGGYTGVFASADGIGPALKLLGGATSYTSDYSFHQASYMGGYGVSYSGFMNMIPTVTANDIAGTGKYIVLWGANIPTTHNPFAYPWVKGVEDMKRRDPNSKVIFIGPEFSEGGIAIADEWIQSKPYTDTALILGMIHEMIVNTVNADGTLKSASERWLDLSYLDTMVYGFFDSPEYWVDTVNSAMSMTAQTGYQKVEAVPDGQSLSAYVMGNDDRLTKLAYGNDCYMAAQFSTQHPNIKRNKAICSYEDHGGNTKYAYKKAMKKPKDAAWASAITGVPAQRIKDLAKMYVDAAKSGDPIWNEWSGGQLKQMEGCVTFYALQTLLLVSKNWGITGSGVANKGMGRKKEDDANQITAKMLTPNTWSTLANMPTHPQPSVVQWHTAIKYAFGKKLKDNGYVPNIPDWKVAETGKGQPVYKGVDGEVYYDDGGVKGMVTRNLTPGTTTREYTDTDGRTYYEYQGRIGGTPKYSGMRFIFNSAGNIPMNQHGNTIDSMSMFQHLPTYGYADAKYNVDMKDAFYMVCFDNFMSPSARFSDYVLPAKTTWEQEDFISIEASGNLYVDSVIKGPGEAMSTWDFAREWIKAYGGADAAKKFTGDGPDTTFKQIVQKVYNRDVKTNNNSPFADKTWEEFLEKPISVSKPSEVTTEKTEKSVLRTGLDTYLRGGTVASTYFYPDVLSVDATIASGVYGFGWDQFAETATCPNQSKRFHVYSGSLVWRYENLYSKWHGHLPVAEQGQKNEDEEGDPLVYPIIVYVDYQDDFRVAYGLNDNSSLDGRYLLTTTHDRFRAHSSQAENPYLRELTHRVEGGSLYSGNDHGSYAISSNPAVDCDKFPSLNSLIGADGRPTDKAKASYADLWVNDEDFAGFNDGELVKVENEIGAVICAIRKTKRCVRGFVGLHQGCWFDPRTIDGQTVDVGGCCNTLMPSIPSRIDHGNGQQSAMVKITKF